jgi:hypothetical protein
MYDLLHARGSRLGVCSHEHIRGSEDKQAAQLCTQLKGRTYVQRQVHSLCSFLVWHVRVLSLSEEPPRGSASSVARVLVLLRLYT